MRDSGRFFFLLACALLAHGVLVTSAFGQQQWGSPFYEEHFTSQEYQGHQTNWSIAQHPSGKIYVGNDVNGVLEYDGVNWRQIEMPTRSTIRSLDVSKDGTVYVGTGSDFGYLAPDSLGQLKYTSLVDYLDEAYYGFSDVWGTHATSEGVYFQTRSHIFKWNGEYIQVWESEEAIHTSFEVQDKLVVRTVNKGLMTISGESLVVLPGGEAFENRSVFSIEPYGEDSWLLATRTGFHLYDGEETIELESDLDDILDEYSLYHGTAINDSTYAYSLIGDGVYVMRADGSIARHFHSSGDLPDNEVNFLHTDQGGGLWMALHNGGVYRVHPDPSLSVFSGDIAPTGVINSIRGYGDGLFVATNSGLYALQRHAGLITGGAEFAELISPRNIHTIRPFRENLLIASDEGLDWWSTEEEQEVMAGRTFAITILDRDQLVAVGHASGLRLLSPTPDDAGWEINQVAGIDHEIRSISYAQNGEFWAGAGRGAIYRIEYDGLDALAVEAFGEDEGVPDVGFTLLTLDDEIFLISREGGFRFSEDLWEFVPDNTFIPDREKADEIMTAGRGSDGRVYIVYANRVEIIDITAEEGISRTVPDALRYPRGDIVRSYVDDEGIIWVSDLESLVRYDPHSEFDYSEERQPLIRRIEDAVTGATIFGGAPTEKVFDAEGTLEVPYSQNALRISFAQPEFNVRRPLEYQHRTAGKYDEWSEWDEGTTTTIGSLSEGGYIFEVRARNERGAISNPVQLSINILPPWYRTWWAYGAYILIGVFVTMAYRQYRELAEAKRRSQEQAQALARERLVTERLKQANESLDQANKLKETFLANTSHELRTPLTAILGFASVLKEEADGRHEEFLGIIEENGERLLRTLNALLDLAKIRAGIEEPELERVDIPVVVQGVVRMMDPLAENKNIKLNYDGPPYGVSALLDEAHFRRIMQNLIGNAVKFTEEGHITVDVEPSDGQVVVKVTDTGIGISQEFLPELFDEFQQESSGTSRDYEGTGLGLAISSRLVQVMDGSITVESEKGEGTVFTVTFDLLEEQEPVESAGQVHDVEGELKES